MKVKTNQCGLFIEEEHECLTPAPDGINDKETIVKVKCPYSVRDMTPEEAIAKRKILFWKTDYTLNKKT